MTASLIALGVVLALSSLGRPRFASAWDIIPALIALSGILRILTARRVYAVVRGAFKVAFAAWLYLCLAQRWGLSFQNSWPALLILLGACALLRGVCKRNLNQRQGEIV